VLEIGRGEIPGRQAVGGEELLDARQPGEHALQRRGQRRIQPEHRLEVATLVGRCLRDRFDAGDHRLDVLDEPEVELHRLGQLPPELGEERPGRGRRMGGQANRLEQGRELGREESDRVVGHPATASR
jgi:hypothetical protein